MKSESFPCRGARLVAAALLASVGILAISPRNAFAAGEPGFLEKMKELQDKMSERFHETWRDLWGDEKAVSHSERSIATAAFDLREQPDAYIVRLSLPNRDLEKVEINLKDKTLRVIAPAEDSVARYEQVIELGEADEGGELKIDRKPDEQMIVVTIPKVMKVAEASPTPKTPLEPLTDWEREISDRMRRMQREMDHIFEDAFKKFRIEPYYRDYFNQPLFGSSLDIQEEGDNYVVRAYLPDRDTQNVNVTVEKRLLRVEAKEQRADEEQEGAGVSRSMREAAYSQVLTLPGPVQADKMKVERKEGMLVITLPKAKS